MPVDAHLTRYLLEVNSAGELAFTGGLGFVAFRDAIVQFGCCLDVIGMTRKNSIPHANVRCCIRTRRRTVISGSRLESSLSAHVVGGRS
jgi:hypothetical protein